MPDAGTAEHRTVRVEPVMGTMVTVDIRDPHPLDPAVEAATETAIAWLHEVDATFSA